MGAQDAISVPQWGHPFDLSSIETRIDSALSSANSILNFILSPVRSFVGAVLHPVIWFADVTVGWVYDVVHWVFDRVADLSNMARNAVRVAVDDAWDFAANWATDVRHWAENAIAGARALATTLAREASEAIVAARDFGVNFARTMKDEAVSVARGLSAQVEALARSLIANVERVARDLAADATRTARSLFDDAVRIGGNAVAAANSAAQRLVGEAVSTARGFASEAARIAGDALDAVVRNLVKPIGDKLDGFVDGPWRWALGLLKVVEDAAEWIVWTGVNIVPELVDLFRWALDVATSDFDDLLGVGMELARDSMDWYG